MHDIYILIEAALWQWDIIIVRRLHMGKSIKKKLYSLLGAAKLNMQPANMHLTSPDILG